MSSTPLEDSMNLGDTELSGGPRLDDTPEIREYVVITHTESPLHVPGDTYVTLEGYKRSQRHVHSFLKLYLAM